MTPPSLLTHSGVTVERVRNNKELRMVRAVGFYMSAFVMDVFIKKLYRNPDVNLQFLSMIYELK